MSQEPDGVGERHKVRIDGDGYYFVVTIGEDGWIHLMAKAPDENKFENRRVRAALDMAGKEWGKMINKLLGNVGRPVEEKK